MNLILVGAPGSGKGTQGKMIAKELGYVVISTGDILRGEVEAKSEIGLFAKSYMDKGSLVPDEVIVEIVKKRIEKEDCKDGFILDGFPRNIDQARTLDRMIIDSGKNVDLVLNFEIAEEILVKRITGRFTCKGCGAIYNRFFKAPKKEGVCDSCGSTEFENRKDDTEEVIKNRLKVYNDTAIDLINYYKEKGLVASVDAALEPSVISEKIKQIITTKN